MADFDALKDQWSEIEDRDGIRLSWNTFPSSRMVWQPLASRRSPYSSRSERILTWIEGSLPSRRSHRRALYTLEGEDRHSSASIPACGMPGTMQGRPQPFLVGGLVFAGTSKANKSSARLTCVPECGYVPSASAAMASRRTTKTSLSSKSPQSSMLGVPALSTAFPRPFKHLRSSSLSWIHARKRTA